MKRLIHITFSLFFFLSCVSTGIDMVSVEEVEEAEEETHKENLQQQQSQEEEQSQDEHGSGGDLQHIAISITLKDKKGNNLLNPEYEGILDLDKINASFRDCIYYLNQDDGSFSESYGKFIGLFSEHLAGEPYIRFGWLSAYDFYEYENIIFHWSVEQSDTVTVYNKFEADKFEVDRRFYLNGKRADSFITIIIE